MVDRYLNSQVKDIAFGNLKFDDIKDMMSKLFIYYRENGSIMANKDDKLLNVSSKCLNANQYVRMYSE